MCKIDSRSKRLNVLFSDIEINANIDTVNPLEAYQNSTLRPILKFQNDLLVRYFEEYADSRKFKIQGSTSNDIQQFIAQTFTNDRSLKTFYHGVICAYFNSTELDFYLLHRKEVGKRISSMLQERLRSAFVV